MSQLLLLLLPVGLLKRRSGVGQQVRLFVEATRVKWVKDRALDHVVEKEKNLRAVVGLKNLIKSEPSNSIPISVAADNKTQLCLPTRAADFIRKYPTIFQEFVPPGGAAARPHVRLTPQALALHEEEHSVYQTESYRQDVADRLLKLIMLTRVNKIPIHILETLKWDLGLPPDYARTLVTHFPDYFQITNSHNSLALELVCWSDHLAVSVMESKPLVAFPLQYSAGYDLEKKVKAWLDAWQKLPYISPYQDASHLPSKSDHAQRWTVAVMHELLHLFISKKTDRHNIVSLADYLGFGSRFKRALINHPGIFYVSNKIRTHTVVLREAFKRNLLLHNHPLMSIRYQYIHLMNKLNTHPKPTDTTTAPSNKQTTADDQLKDDDLTHNDDYQDSSQDEDEQDEDQEDAPHTSGRGRMSQNEPVYNETSTPSRTSVRARTNKSAPNMVGDRVPTPPPRRINSRKEYNSGVRSPGRTDHSNTRGRRSTERTNAYK